MNTNFWDKSEYPSDAVRCPECHEANAHIREVEYFTNLASDSAQKVRMHGSTVMVEHGDFNPSPDRDAVRIHYWGECVHAWFVEFVQHKGTTFIVQRKEKTV